MAAVGCAVRGVLLLLTACRADPDPLPQAGRPDTVAETGLADTGEAPEPEPEPEPEPGFEETVIGGAAGGAMLGWRVAAEAGAVWASAPGAGAVYRFEVADLDGEADVSAPRFLAQGGGLFGYGLARTGDVIAIGAPAEEGSAGAVYLFPADAAGVAKAEDAQRVAGPDPGSSFGVYLVPGAAPGTALAAATDDDSGGVAGGAVYRVSAAGAERLVSADAAGQQLGTGMAEADLDGDGLADLIVGGGSEGVGNSGEGSVGVFWGPLAAGATLADADLRLTGASAFDHLGNKVAAGEDLDGDGYGDLAVAAYWGSERAPRGGVVYVFAGPLAGVEDVSDADATVWGETEYGYGGIALELLGDATGDGAPELLIGEYGASRRGDVVGAARLFSGIPAGAVALTDAGVTVWGEAPGGSFGYSLSAADVDQSGRSDLVISAYSAEGAAGAVSVLPGEGL